MAPAPTRHEAELSLFSRNGGGLRPDRTGSPNKGIDPTTDRLHFLDPAAFSVQTVNTAGNSGRNGELGNWAFTTGLSLVKHFRPTGQTMLDLRFEAFRRI